MRTFAPMSWTEKRVVKVAVLDLYEGAANQGMRCIRNILIEWAEKNDHLIDSENLDAGLNN